MTEVFRTLVEALAASPALALGAAALLGVAAVYLSACHLGGIPIAVGFLQLREDDPGRRASLGHRARLSLLLAIGLLLTLGLAAGATLAAGRMLGDLWGIGPWLVAAFLLLAGLLLLDAIPLSLGADLSRLPLPRSSSGRALAVGGLLGVTLGPCTFGFLAPLFGASLGSSPASSALAATGLFAAFAVGHLLAVVSLGVLGASLAARLHARRGAALVARRGFGILFLLGGLYSLSTIP